MDLKFRNLRADEIECMVKTQVKGKGAFLCIYKNARADMNILDETVGACNWQRHHSRDNQNCVVSIWDEDKRCWIDKEDAGEESSNNNGKGLASSSFKRACTNWGIGRALYTAPRMWVSQEDLKIDDSGKIRSFFDVEEVIYDELDIIIRLVIKTSEGKTLTFTQNPATVTRKDAVVFDREAKLCELRLLAKEKHVYIEEICQTYNASTVEDLSNQNILAAIYTLENNY